MPVGAKLQGIYCVLWILTKENSAKWKIFPNAALAFSQVLEYY
jgi:hypothetical protein